MDAPRSMEVSATQRRFGRALHAVAGLEMSSKVAIVCVIFGWFFMNTLLVTLGSLQHGVRFFEMSAVIADPSRLFFDGDTPLHRLLFGSLCVACLAGPLAPQFMRAKHAWLGYFAPLALMLLCSVALYWRTSGEFFSAATDTRSLGGSFIHFANDLVRRGSDLVSRHVAVGAGGYLALIGSLVLAGPGVRKAHASR